MYSWRSLSRLGCSKLVGDAFVGSDSRRWRSSGPLTKSSLFLALVCETLRFLHHDVLLGIVNVVEDTSWYLSTLMNGSSYGF